VPCESSWQVPPFFVGAPGKASPQVCGSRMPGGLSEYLTQKEISIIKSKIKEQFEELLPQIPDFGNKKINQFSIDMIKNTLSIAFYRVLKQEGFQVRLIGQMLNEIAEVYYANLNPLMKYLIRRPYLSSSFQR
jgi:predicted XRE-type DNA-binding protein